ncbi:hypothetical protein NQ318_003646 [Aromia moschata]|uniref:Uncharacterized protein n=1 Tax=Aromia moschata TaxID=1265417 RepID=A0AAV8Y1C8_9CUCU|nr:hypothetical protein NQ318_003646 [Aromia moschata]
MDNGLVVECQTEPNRQTHDGSVILWLYSITLFKKHVTRTCFIRNIGTEHKQVLFMFGDTGTSRPTRDPDLMGTSIFSINKNSYLHSKYEEINPRLINRCVQKARDFEWQPVFDLLGQPRVFNWQDVYDLEPPFNRLTSDQPTIPAPNVDVTRRPVAFGRWAMPKLRRELHHANEKVVIAAIESIADLSHDSEKGYEAVRLKIVDRYDKQDEMTIQCVSKVPGRLNNSLAIQRRRISRVIQPSRNF